MTHSSTISLRQHLLIIRAHLRCLTPFAKWNDDGAVILFPEHRIAYVPVPKCANSSIRAALLPLLGIKPSSVSRIQEFKGFRTTTMKAFCRTVHTPDWLTFTVVRNPYSRYASAYLDKLVTREAPLRPLVRMGLEKGDSFARYMQMLAKWPAGTLNEHFAPQTTILRHPLRLDGLQVGKVESIADDWLAIAQAIKDRSGIGLPDLENRNAAKAEMDWRSLYDSETIGLARRMAAADFARFGYSPDFDR